MNPIELPMAELQPTLVGLGKVINHAWPPRFGVGEQNPEVQIVRENHRLIVPGPLHDFGVRCAGVTNLRPMHGLESIIPEQRNPLRREIHVNHEPHVPASGTSISSTRHAA